MMLNKWVILASLAVAVQCATITRKDANIPVEIRYEDKPEISVSADNKKESENVEPLRSNPVRNLDEKIQLSPSDLSEALKHLPVQEEVVDEQANIALRSNIEDTNKFEKLGEDSKPSSMASLLREAEELVLNGIKNLRKKLEGEKGQPSAEDWDNLEKSLSNYFEEEKSKATFLKQDQSQNQNIFQNIWSNVQNITGNFIQSVQGAVQQVNSPASANGTQSDETSTQQPGFGQQFINNFNNGVQNIQNSFQQLINGGNQATTSNTNLSESSTQPGTGIFSNIVNNVQNILNPGQTNKNPGNGTQADETATVASPAGPVQQVIQNVGGQIGNAFNQFVSVINPNRPGAASGNQTVSGDEAGATTAAPGGPFQIFQQIGSSVSSSFSNLISGGNNNNKPPGTSGDDPTTASPTNFIQNVGQNIGQNIGQLWSNIVGGGSSSTTGGAGGSTNPIVAGVQQVGNQISQAVTGNPVESIQNAISGGSKNATEAPIEPVKEDPVKEDPVKEEPVKEEPEKKEIMETAE